MVKKDKKAAAVEVIEEESRVKNDHNEEDESLDAEDPSRNVKQEKAEKKKKKHAMQMHSIKKESEVKEEEAAEADGDEVDEEASPTAVQPRKLKHEKSEKKKKSELSDTKSRKRDETQDDAEEDEQTPAKRTKPKDMAKLASDEPQTTGGGGILSDQAFDSLDICEETKSGIRDLGFQMMTLIQSKSIVPLLSGRDLLAQARRRPQLVCGLSQDGFVLMRFMAKKACAPTCASSSRTLAETDFGPVQSKALSI